MASSTTPQWKIPKFSFDVPDQGSEWKKFYTTAIDFLEALEIDPEKEDETKWSWHQIKMMFQGEDRQALQTLLQNNAITSEDQLTPSHALNVIWTSVKEEEHFWHFRDEHLSDFRQEPSKGIHTPNTRITTLIINCKFTHSPTKETFIIMVLAHSVKYHEARDWIRLQDQSTLTYKSLLNHCKLLEQCCE